MKNLFKYIVLIILSWEASFILRKYRPKIVGVTGNVGKTSTKEAVAAILAIKYQVRKSEKSYNSELGVPLTIIGASSAWLNPLGWLKIFYRGLVLIFLDNDYPEWLVLEVGADRPGDIKSVAKRIKFDIAIVSRLPDVPVHIEFFQSKEQVIEEKMSLPLSVRATGLVILNADDSNIMSYHSRLKAKVITYGFSETADIRAENDHIMYEQKDDLSIPVGFAFKVNTQGSNVPVRVYGAVGTHLVYPVLAAIAVATYEGVNLVTAIETLGKHLPPPGRLHLVPGINQSIILDDTYNSSPIALEAALQTLAKITIPAGARKILVMGDMMELGNYTAEAHKRAGELAAGICQLILTVGVRAKFAYDAALAAGFPQENIFCFNKSTEAGDWLKDKIQYGDAILIKGSQSARMEKVVERIMAEPERRKELLVRQDEEWQRR